MHPDQWNAALHILCLGGCHASKVHLRLNTCACLCMLLKCMGVLPCSDNFFGRKAGVAAGIQAYEKVQALLQGEDEFKSSARAQQEFDSFFAQPHVNQVRR